MSTRLPGHGRLINRGQSYRFTFNGKRMTGYAGDTLASALLANGQTLMGRSFKYHRPRGVVASGAEEPNALVTLGTGSRREPNQRATTTEIFDGLTATSQNHWPSLDHDVGAVNAWLSRLLPAGFYYKTFIHPRAFWKHIYEPLIRHAAGLGKAPDAQSRDPDSYEHFYAFTDVLVIGGGVAGLQAAFAAAQSGAQVLVLEQNATWGGRTPVDGGTIDGVEAETWITQTLAALKALPNVRLRRRTMGAGVYDHGYVLGYERLTDHSPDAAGPRHRLWRIRASRIITATGAIERPLSFAGNDVPGVMLASAMRDYVVNYGVSPGTRLVVVTNNDDAYRTALILARAGLSVRAIVDTRPNGGGALMQEALSLGLTVHKGAAVIKAKGGKALRSVLIGAYEGDGSDTTELACDAIAMSGGWSPVVHLWSHCGGKLTWDSATAAFRPDRSRAPTNQNGEAFVIPTGAANGELHLSDILQCASRAGAQAAGQGQRQGQDPEPHEGQAEKGGIATPVADAPDEAALAAVWMMPAHAPTDLRCTAWLDYQNDVKVSDVDLAAQEGFTSVEHTKRYTTLGMATDQGKLSNINGLATLAQALGAEIPTVGTTTFRPPYTPISMGAIAGPERGDMFQPIRKTPLHAWHGSHGAHWEPVGQWRRPYAYPQAGETVEAAVLREVRATRSSLGLLDASTLGKLIVKGPDAGRFLDMLYTNKMSTLKPGRCRYGLICSENGFLSDDGVVARLDDMTFLCHTTTGGADRVHAHMEEWLQTEWWDWKVWVVNATEQFAQIAVVGPNARHLLEVLGGLDVSAEALPFMGWAEGQLAGYPARVYRISFSGELSYEIAVPANLGRALWDRLLEAGQTWGITPYGTEALHIMRAEKGFIMIGDETDGTVIPQDLGLDWAIAKQKADYIGKRAQDRVAMTDPNRWRLVGLETLDGSVLQDGAYAIAEGRNANGQTNTQGRVTSTYFSPTLNRGIALGLVRHGPDRLGEVLRFTRIDGPAQSARIVSPVFYDPEGERQNV